MHVMPTWKDLIVALLMSLLIAVAAKTARAGGSASLEGAHAIGASRTAIGVSQGRTRGEASLCKKGKRSKHNRDQRKAKREARRAKRRDHNQG